ncbi:MAG: exodeoxyribonuclease I [Gammaproteobacteria bacterium]|nr:exodeoxyribonuclease I [Gammaproteobacteria bacterium]
MGKQPSLYWHDYETFGTNPRKDRIAQFAGIRTDEELNIIDDPLVIYCKAADDVLPQPEACLVTGITPQKTHQDGLIEAEFIAAIHQEFATPQTCVVGFNNIRFDDEFTRYSLYRNFFDPYAREWQNGCSRWDIIDMVRITRALRPEGIEWPVDENGIATNRLELITQANGISHEAAHDALSDVYATIAVAKLIKDKQPRLYDYIYQHKTKQKVSQLLNLAKPTPVLHASGMYPGDVCNTAMVIPLAQHPVNKNGIIVYDLRYNPQALIDLDAEEIKTRIYTPRDELPEGVERIAIKTIHINKCPVVVPLNTLNDESARRLNIDRDAHMQHLDMLNRTKGLTQKLHAVFKDNPFEPIDDPDQSLYSGGFFSDNDRERMVTIRSTPATQLAALDFNFDDGRLPEMLFRYRARNYPDSLTEKEQQDWNEYKRQRFTDTDGGASITIAEYMEKLKALLAEADRSEQQKQMLVELQDYGNDILTWLNKK